MHGIPAVGILQVRSALVAAVFRKSLRLGTLAKNKYTHVGRAFPDRPGCAPFGFSS